MQPDKDSSFCWILDKPDYVPWFMKDVRRFADTFSWVPTYNEVAMRAKWLGLNLGLATTPYLADMCKQSKGVFKNNIRTYKTPEPDEIATLMIVAFNQIYKDFPAILSGETNISVWE